jgi:hypothetical protein
MVNHHLYGDNLSLIELILIIYNIFEIWVLYIHPLLVISWEWCGSAVTPCGVIVVTNAIYVSINGVRYKITFNVYNGLASPA